MRISDWSSDVCSSDLRTPNALTINDPEPYRAWSHNHGSHLQSLDQDARNRLTRWLDRLSGASARVPGRTAMQATLAEVELSLLRLPADERSEEHTSELQSLMRISYAVFCLKKKNK